jgi:hypothetical protein
MERGARDLADFLRSKLPERARSIQKQPIIGGGIFGGIGARRNHETAEIPGLFYMISNPSRGASTINSLRLFSHNLLRCSHAGN